MNSLPNLFSKKLLILTSLLIVLPVLIGAIFYFFYPAMFSSGMARLTALFPKSTSTTIEATRTPEQIQASVLAASQSAVMTGKVLFNIPVVFNDSVEFKQDALFDGNLGILGSLTVNGKKIDGTSTAPLAGAGITIVPGTTPTITNTGVTSFNGAKGDISFTGSTGLTIAGNTITNSGVTSLGGQTGSIVLTGSSGILVNGTEITNSDPGSAQNIFKSIIVGSTTLAASSNTDALTLAAGNGIILSAIGKTVTIAGATQNWQELLGVLSPTNITDDLTIGGSGSPSAKFQVVGLTGNTTVGGTLGVSGVSSFSSLTTSSSITDNGGLSVSGTTNLNGSVTIGSSSVNTIALNGLLLTSLLPQTSAVNLGSVSNPFGSVYATDIINASSNGQFGFWITGSGAVALVNASNDLLVGGTTTASAKFRVAGPTGNVTVGGSLNVTGAATLAGVTTTSLNNSGNTTLGTNSSNTVTINGLLNNSLIPASMAVNLGSSSSTFGTLYAQNVVTNAQSGQNGFWQLNNGTLSSANITNDLVLGGTSTPSAKFQVSGTTGSVSTSGSLSFNNATNAIVQAAIPGYTTLNGNRYAFVRPITVTNNSTTQTMTVGTQVTIAASGALLTDLCTNTQSDSNDLRVAYNTTEIARNITRSCNSSLSISFTLQSALAPSASTTAYYLYYSNATIASSGSTYSYIANSQIDSMDSAASWSSTDNTNLALSQETTIKQEGTGSLKAIQTTQANPGNIGTWTTTSQAQFPQALVKTTSVSVTIGGTTYIYAIAGSTNFGTAGAGSTVYKALLDSSGNIGAWATTSQGQLPVNFYNQSNTIATIGGTNYIYSLGGGSVGTTRSVAYKAQIDGSGNIGSWSTTSQAQLPQSMYGQTSTTVTIAGTTYLYNLGGSFTNAVPFSTAYKAQLDTSGNIGAWSTTSQGQLPQTLAYHTATAVSIGGTNYLYILGGSTSGTTSPVSTVYKAQLDTSGNIGAWSTTNQGQLPQTLEYHTNVPLTVNGTTYFYMIGGYNGTTYQSTVYKAQLDTSGNIGAWTTTGLAQLPQLLGAPTSIGMSASGTNYLYTLEGYNGTTNQSTVYKSQVASPSFIASRTISSTDLTNYKGIQFDVYSSRTGQYVNFEFSNDGGTTWQSFPFTVNTANTWQTVGIDISGLTGAQKNTVTKIRFNVTDPTTGFTAYFDDIEAAPTAYTDLAPTLSAAAAAAASSSNLAINAQGSGTVNLNYDPTNAYAGNGGISIYNGGTTKLFSVDGNGNTVIGNGTTQLSLSATNGFLYLSSSAGKPTGVPTTYAGNVAEEYDTTNNKDCIYNAGWKCSGAFADYAEWAPAKGASAGDLVSLTNEKNATDDATAPFMLGKSQTSYDSKLVGVVSVYAESEQVANGYKRSSDYHAIALAGRVPVKVSTINGPIAIGDMLTSSSIPGVAMKATKAGIIIGKSTEEYSASDSASTASNAAAVGTVIAFIQPGYADPGVVLASDGNLTNAGSLSTTLPTTPVVLAQARTSSINTPLVDQVSSSLSLRADGLGQAGNDGQGAVASMSAQVTASTSADLQGQIDTLTKAVNLLMTTQLNGNSLLSTTGTGSAGTILTNDLTITGKTQVNDLGITGNVTAGLITLNGLAGEINTLAGALRLQGTGLNGINLENGKVTIDPLGNIVSQGELTTTKLNIDSSATSSASIGKALIAAGKTSVTVQTTALHPNSFIFATPDSFPVPVSKKKVSATSFELDIEQALSKSLEIDWWIVN